MKEFKEFVNNYFKYLGFLGTMIVILSSFFLFTNLTTEFYDTPKFLVLLVVSGILLIMLGVRFAINNKVVFTRTPLDLPLLLLLAVGIVSAILSPALFVSILGNQLRIHGSLISLAVYIIFYFALVNQLKGIRQVKWALSLTIIGAAILSIISLLAYAGVKLLPPPWSHGINFTPSGSSFSTTAVLTILIPFLVLKLSSTNMVVKALNSLLLALFGVTIALTGTWQIWIAALGGLILTLITTRFFDNLNSTSLKNRHFQTSLVSLAVPLVIVAIVTIISLFPPITGVKNLLFDQAKNFPKENQLGFIPSWKISVSSFRDNPFQGSGPATFLFDFTSYKPIEINSSKIWNINFDTAFNEYLQILATLGGVGLIALISLTALFVSSSYPLLAYNSANTNDQTTKKALAISGLLFFTILALHSSTLVLWVFGLFILACFYIANLSVENTTKSWSLGTNVQHTIKKFAFNIISPNSSQETIVFEALPSILLTLFLGVVLFVFFFAGKLAVADYHHRTALNAISQNQGIVAYNELVAAEKLNPWSDSYHTDLAQTNFALANAIAQAKGPTEASPSGSLTDQDKQNIQVLLQQSINEGRNATTLNPRSALNWEILGLLYRQIAGVAQNALVFSLDSYGRAIFADPLNPQLRLSVGGVYYATSNFDLAIRFFTDAINLKPDFANGYYNLSVALRDKGDLNTAQAAAEKVLTLVDQSSPDYKAANTYLTDLKNRIASGSAQQSAIQPPAAQTQGSLQQKQLPKVVNVGNPPEKIATPTAVKKPNSTPEPTPNP